MNESDDGYFVKYEAPRVMVMILMIFVKYEGGDGGGHDDGA